ncbi:MAG: murein biosynthesis integral membrane protein MurJ, partial [Acidimicrobiia bacterium]|nr:murein biosynthesis integral membrane protein MurJ [Acidimicrobiia bacterium]
MSSRSILSRSVTSRIGRAALIVGGGILLSRVLGLVRDMVFASVLGANTFTDEYQVAFIIPDFLNYLLAGGYMAITFIPILSRHLSNDDEEGGWAAFSAILRPLTAGMLIFVAVAMVMARPVIDLIEPGFTAEQVDRAAHLTRIVLPAQVFFVVGTLFMAVQYAKEKFFIPTLAPILYNVGIIAGGLLIQGDEPSPDGFAWGVLGGAIVGNFLIQWYGAHQAGLRIQLGGSW